ncbi:transposase [Salinimonas marina]|uniref:transposase n=1 Tax=Salinimonas marina TaxID=2785918 RepID=UPI0038CD4A15
MSGKSFEHRRHWVEQRILFLGSVFSIDVCAYAVMSNHTHLVLFVNKAAALNWTDLEVLKRWHKLHKGTLLTRQYVNESKRKSMSKLQINSVKATVEVYRHRLFDISWFMRLLNEYIARKANKEEGCTGRFWEGRFKSQALLDEAALLACMTYVDLNPVRANIAKSPDSSAYTSIKKRLSAARHKSQPIRLCHFKIASDASVPAGLPFSLNDYLGLVRFTHQRLIAGSEVCKSIEIAALKKFHLSAGDWQSLVAAIEQRFSTQISIGIARSRRVVGLVVALH